MVAHRASPLQGMSLQQAQVAVADDPIERPLFGELHKRQAQLSPDAELEVSGIAGQVALDISLNEGLAGSLGNVRELVPYQPPPITCSGTILTRAEYDVVSNGIGAGVYRLRRRRLSITGMYSHMAEVMCEPRFHELAYPCLEGLAGRAQCLLHALRCP
jgi:hypothetical protein